jgi:hypothetical protein
VSKIVVLAVLSAAVLPVPERITTGGDVLTPKQARAGGRSTATPPARNPEIAVEEEYDIARRRGTPGALELFIARHPDSALAERARSELKELKR